MMVADGTVWKTPRFAARSRIRTYSELCRTSWILMPEWPPISPSTAMLTDTEQGRRGVMMRHRSHTHELLCMILPGLSPWVLAAIGRTIRVRLSCCAVNSSHQECEYILPVVTRGRPLNDSAKAGARGAVSVVCKVCAQTWTD